MKFHTLPYGLAFISCLLLNGCATSSNYQHVMNNWQGANATTLVKTWGEPDGEIKLSNGDTEYMYLRSRNFVQPASPIVKPVIINASGVPASATTYNGMFIGGQNKRLYCRTWFVVNSEGKIIGSRFQGNNCISNNPQSLQP